VLPRRHPGGRDWEIVEQVGETDHYEVERDERGNARSRWRITGAELTEAERQLELEAEAKYGDPDDPAAEEIPDSDLYDIEREMAKPERPLVHRLRRAFTEGASLRRIPCTTVR